MEVFLLILVIAVVIWMFAFSDGGGSEIFIKTAKDAGGVYGGGMAGLAAAAAETKRSRAGTGLFISVKDIDYPEWHIKIRDKKMLSRWFDSLKT